MKVGDGGGGEKGERQEAGRGVITSDSEIKKKRGGGGRQRIGGFRNTANGLKVEKREREIQTIL